PSRTCWAKSAPRGARTTAAPWSPVRTSTPTDWPSPWTAGSPWPENCWSDLCRWASERSRRRVRAARGPAARNGNFGKPPVTARRHRSTIGLSVAGSPPFLPDGSSACRAPSPTEHRGMHMNSVPQHLLSEDRQEFERVLDEALRSAPHRPELAAVGQRLNTEQLRTMALGASAIITAAAAAEYQHYVKVREELRR